MLILFVPLLLVLAAAGLSGLLKYTVEKSLFLLLCAMITIVLLLGLPGVLIAGLYICYAAVVALIIYLVITLVKDHRANQKISLSCIFTPGTVIFLLSTTLYAIASWGSVISFTDDAVHWGLATLYMLRTGVLFKGVQTLAVPMLNYIITGFTGYSEHVLFAGRWIFIWAAFCLPISGMEWKKWYKALIYAVAAYMLCGTIATVPRIYMDLPLGVFAGSLCAFWAIKCKKSSKDFLLMALGIFISIQIKNQYGLIGVLILLFVLVDSAVIPFITRAGTPVKKKILYYIGLILMVPFGTWISITSRGVPTRMDSETLAGSPYLSGINIALGLLAAVMLTGLVALLFYWSAHADKGKKLKIWVAITGGAVILLILLLAANLLRGLLVSISEENQKFLLYYYNKFWEKGFWGFPIKMLLPMLYLFVGFSAFLCLKKEFRAKYIGQTAAMTVILLINAAFIGLSYVLIFSPHERDILAEFYRYSGSAALLVITWLVGFITLCEECWQENKIRPFICSLALLLLVNDDAPALGDVALAPINSWMLGYKYGIRPRISVNSQEIMNYTNEQDSIFVLSIIDEDNDEVMCRLTEVFVSYESTPRTIYWLRYRDDLNQFLDLIAGSDYLYMHNINEDFIERFGHLFQDQSLIEDGRLFKINPIGSKLFEPTN